MDDQKVRVLDESQLIRTLDGRMVEQLQEQLLETRGLCERYKQELAEANRLIEAQALKYEYRHIANNQFSKLKDSIVELMNEGWEPFSELEKNRQAYQSETEYSQIMRRVKNGN